MLYFAYLGVIPTLNGIETQKKTIFGVLETISKLNHYKPSIKRKIWCFFYVSMAFTVEMTPKEAKQSIYTLLYTFYITQSIYLQEEQKIPMFMVVK